MQPYKRLLLCLGLSLIGLSVPHINALAPSGAIALASPREWQEPPSGSEKIIPLTAYSQLDPQWASYLYGNVDPLSTHGCGPAVLATAISTLNKQVVTPPEVASWSSTHGFFSPGFGSAHELIPSGAKAYGLKVEHLPSITTESLRLALTYDKLLIFLMGPGNFTSSGHFIVVNGYDADGQFIIFDPASPERTSIRWSSELLLSQLLTTAYSGGPIWVLSK
ncbi:C39 family peptidase [Lachnospiraceae bacterium OttesenSCG-928-J05]|nr:C39 family peptidase [Lachnospiraceae bacterium OttesenSCG-928-J05]